MLTKYVFFAKREFLHVCIKIGQSTLTSKIKPRIKEKRERKKNVTEKTKEKYLYLFYFVFVFVSFFCFIPRRIGITFFNKITLISIIAVAYLNYK